MRDHFAVEGSKALLVASTPTIVCAICSASLAYKERPQWLRFAVLAVLADVGSIVTLRAVRAQQLAWTSDSRIRNGPLATRGNSRQVLLRP
ncbi:hypothetical protein [Bradyrhizobium valentinum]|uniref:Uncharacterized protein n=1 Tax=Bradyrhizobium valentinum TaxID=1518501 RepID=A0A0R3LJ11_9BRAD|nr:hypothetical protein [Bradyrhizobium valentinum]KRQ94646.1 hypothetical protein CQ10_07215 [Bradyrhizobium valentinum]KRR07770.1 hypothetical protein CP49_07005 [Bradyrhizobium valentinum]